MVYTPFNAKNVASVTSTKSLLVVTKIQHMHTSDTTILIKIQNRQA